MPDVSLNGATLHYEAAGTGPTLLLVHGFPLDHTMWAQQLDGLSDICRVIAPDLRGFGQSTGGADVLTMETLADDLAAFLDRLDIREPVAFCGLSMGGYIAWQFMRRHAERVWRLILCDTRAVADSEEAARGRRQTAQRVLAEGSQVVADSMEPRLFCEQTRRDNGALVAAARQVMLAARPATVAAALRGMAERPDVSGDLPQIDKPTLVICGQHDVISTVDEMRGLATAMPHARFVVVPDAGHMPPLEQPARFNAALREFLLATTPE